MPRPSHLSRFALMLVLAACGGRATPSAAPTVGARLDDAEAAGLALLGGNVESGCAALAPGRSRNADVLAYAARVATDHGAMNAELADLSARLDVEPREPPMTAAVRERATGRRARVRPDTGRAFDVAFLDASLASHRELLVLLEQALSSASRPALREHLAALRPVVSAHLAHAEQLRATLVPPR